MCHTTHCSSFCCLGISRFCNSRYENVCLELQTSLATGYLLVLTKYNHYDTFWKPAEFISLLTINSYTATAACIHTSKYEWLYCNLPLWTKYESWQQQQFECPSLYNCIIGRTALAELFAVSSTIHLKLKQYSVRSCNGRDRWPLIPKRR